MSAEPPAIAVVVPSLNVADLLSHQLTALSEQRFEHRWELVVVDNGSEDGTGDVARRHPAHRRCSVRVVREPRRGLNVARNAGVRAGSAPLIAICDADDVVADDWLAAMTDALRTADLVGGSLEVREINPPSACALRGWTGVTEPISPTNRGLGFLDQAFGGNIGFRRAVWDDLGGFDETYDDGGDDVEFVWRAQLRDWSFAPAADAVIHIRARAGGRATFRQSMRDGEGTAHLYAAFRHVGMPARTIRDVVSSAHAIVRHVPALFGDDLARRGHLIRSTGKQIGRVRGSVRHRVVYV